VGRPFPKEIDSPNESGLDCISDASENQ